jgi:hypothetical protein
MPKQMAIPAIAAGTRNGHDAVQSMATFRLVFGLFLAVASSRTDNW